MLLLEINLILSYDHGLTSDNSEARLARVVVCIHTVGGSTLLCPLGL